MTSIDDLGHAVTIEWQGKQKTRVFITKKIAEQKQTQQRVRKQEIGKKGKRCNYATNLKGNHSILLGLNGGWMFERQ